MIVVVKIGTSSITETDGTVKADAVAKLCHEAAEVIREGHRVVIVTSGAIGAGLPALGMFGKRPRDPVTLQALSAVGQSRLMALYQQELAEHGLVCGQVLLSPLDFLERSQYLHAQRTLSRLLELDVVPIVNENDAVADDAIRWGDNDRIAALVTHMVGAELLLLLTDIDGVYTADPRRDASASVIAEMGEPELVAASVGGAGTERGSGGMASKVLAARIASLSGARTVIAAAHRPAVVSDAVAGRGGAGTTVPAHPRTLSARKLWIGYAMQPSGTVWVDDGAKRSLLETGASLLPVGVTHCEGDFAAGDAVNVSGPDGEVFARGIASLPNADMSALVGLHNEELPEGMPKQVIHRDVLTILS